MNVLLDFAQLFQPVAQIFLDPTHVTAPMDLLEKWPSRPLLWIPLIIKLLQEKFKIIKNMLDHSKYISNIVNYNF